MKFSLALGVASVLGAVAAQGTYSNPVAWLDLPDIDIIRVNDTFYYSASTFAMSPGAPVLQSKDLVNWEHIGHSVPSLDFGPQYNMQGSTAYVKGIWASFFNYRKSRDLWYWGGCISGTGKTYIYTAKAAAGPWKQSAVINKCYYDAGLLIDDNDKMYIAYGNKQISVAELNAEGTAEVRSKQVYQASFTLEGSRMYKKGGNYYIFLTRPADGQFILKSNNPFGPYTIKTLIDKTRSPIPGSGVPHQGGLVDDGKGKWHYMAFIDAYPGGRIPVLAPVSWGSDGMPSVQLNGGSWGASYPAPLPMVKTKAHTGLDSFAGPDLAPEWEWNHNPDKTKFSVSNGLTLTTATVTGDFYKARNQLTRRILGPSSTGTLVLDVSKMKDGDVAGLSLFRDQSAYIGVEATGTTKRIVLRTGMNLSKSGWSTSSTGSVKSTAPLAADATSVSFKLKANIQPGAGKTASFSYSTDGKAFTNLGSPFTLTNSWEFFLGYRFGIFNYAGKSLGGSVVAKSFDLSQP